MPKMQIINHDASGKLIPDMSQVKLWEVAPETHRIVCQMLQGNSTERSVAP
ncbi:hypothetical protein LFYK43_10750 [Ligilactobacillus salitolerans]|uniref:Uncharacterized protein n=1 Tax=Ligilactobacillus salitolerans TaxID=1808352 RepID=A0A401ISW6_9LACO|nr:hypothetical protein [Ligilactobacillus salitolerans]GBG94616.1 hypothetical protein LFYK43_10750 [Ligilactobacillus salitolerans]